MTLSAIGAGGIGARIRASVVAALAGWAAAMAATLPMQFYKIYADRFGDLRSLLWSLGAGMLVWLAWTLAIAAVAWLIVCLPVIAVVREAWLLRHRRAVVASAGALGCAAVMAMTGTWKVFTPEYSFHPRLFTLYTLLLTVFASIASWVYLRLVAGIRLRR